MTFTIKSRRLGHDVDFYCSFGRYGEGYVRINMSGKPSEPSHQICEGGGFLGSTLRSTEQSFEIDCRKWWRDFLRHTRPVNY